MSSNNTCAEGEEEDCPLCLLPLSTYDNTHPIQCPSNHCNFNSCLDCLEHMIKATKDESTEASDGNVFRVFLHCPNCRSNLGPSIRDTVLLRKVDKYKVVDDIKDHTKDIELSATELRFKDALANDEDIANAVESAQHREDEFFGRGSTNERDRKESEDYYLGSASGASASSFNRGLVWSFDDEEGVEADIQVGPHKSFVFRHHSQMYLNTKEGKEEEHEVEDVQADPTLLCGLDAFMTDQEKQFITAQMISGDTSKLAAATEMMHYISALAKEGIKPSLKRRNSSMMISCPSAKRSILASIKEVIREGNEARRLEEERQGRNAVGAIATRLAANATFAGGKRKQKALVDMEMKQQMQYMKSHPLPLRMPKYAEATASEGFASLTFVDDTWDGTVLDAYSKITVSTSLLTGTVTISKQHAESRGILSVINAGPPCKMPGRGYIDITRPRVLVASITREMGQQGVVKGDVITHFNGEEFKGTASELEELIHTRYEGEVLTFCFNADAAVAEALRRRSLITE